MVRIIVISLAALGIAYAGVSSGLNATTPQQKESPKRVERKPRLGYEDPYFPPTKGHGF